MQLRVTRLCLDCEELFVGSTCPVCASERSVPLITWLPVEERRRWRKSAPRVAPAKTGFLHTLKRMLDRWLADEDPEPTDRILRTRASDVMPKLDFDEPGKEPETPAASAPKLVPEDR
jgi:hypothetical protein